MTRTRSSEQPCMPQSLNWARPFRSITTSMARVAVKFVSQKGSVEDTCLVRLLFLRCGV